MLWAIMQSIANGKSLIHGEGALEPDEVARLVVDLASEKQADDIVMLDIRQLTGFADYFVVMSAQSQRQLDALQEDMVKAMRDLGVSLHHREGTPQSGWVLLDFSDVIVHMFGAEERGILPPRAVVGGSYPGGQGSIIQGSVSLG